MSCQKEFQSIKRNKKKKPQGADSDSRALKKMTLAEAFSSAPIIRSCTQGFFPPVAASRNVFWIKIKRSDFISWHVCQSLLLTAWQPVWCIGQTLVWKCDNLTQRSPWGGTFGAPVGEGRGNKSYSPGFEAPWVELDQVLCVVFLHWNKGLFLSCRKTHQTKFLISFLLRVMRFSFSHRPTFLICHWGSATVCRSWWCEIFL